MTTRERFWKRRPVFLLPLLDVLIVAAVFVCFWDGDFRRERGEFLWALLAVPLLVSSYGFFGLYESHRTEDTSWLIRSVLSAHLGGGLLLAVLLNMASPRPPHGALAGFLAVSATVILAQRWALYAVLHLTRRRGYDTRAVCVIGDWERACKMADRFARHAQWGLRVSCVGEGPPQNRRFRDYPAGAPLEGTLEQLLCTQVIDEVLISVAFEELPQESHVFQLCEQYGLLARVVLDTSCLGMRETSVEELFGEVSLAVGPARGKDLALLAKRSIDVVLAATGLVLTAPLMVAIAALVKLSSRGPVIFRQRRVGLHGRKFTIFKFRTMVDGAEALLPSVAHRNITGGPIFKDPSDWRITNIGRILRRFTLDEFPQLVNVLRGDMSLVGPRPLPVHESNAVNGEHRRRFSMRPGLTCLWQISGRSTVGYHMWMKYDLQYVDGWSLWEDAKIITRTIPIVFSGRGAY